MTEQDTTPQDKTNTSQDNQNTTDNNTPDQTTTQHNAPHYITKSPQHNTKNLPLQVLGNETSAPVVDDGVLSALLMGITWVERGDKTSAPSDDEVISVVDWDGVMEETLSHDEYVKLVVDLKPITKEQADRLVEGVVVEISEENMAFAREWVKGMLFSREAVEMIGAYMDEKEKAIAKSPLLAAVEEFGVPLTEAEREEAKERYGNWQDDKPATVQDWWKDEKGEI